MRLSSKKLTVLLLLILMPFLWCACPFRLMLPGGYGYFPERLFRKDTVAITAIDDTYKIAIESRGTLLLPLSPEGPFPKWSASTKLLAEGCGKRVKRDGLALNQYTLRKDLISPDDYLAGGSIWISEESRTLLVDVELRKEYRELMNQSGTYKNIEVYRPKIIVLTENTPIGDVDGCYVRARGTFNEDGNYFRSAGKAFYAYWSHAHDKSATYEVIGIIHTRDPDGKNRLYLNIISWKKVGQK